MRDCSKISDAREKLIDTANRIEYLDTLKTIACFFVVMLHVTALNTYKVEFQTHEWNVFMAYESITNWAVPMFVMISGAVMLGKEYTYELMFEKCRRLLFLYCAWSAAYLLFDLWNYGAETYSNGLWLQVLLQGHYHLWYLIMLFGLYLITPLLRMIATSERRMKALILLGIVVTFIIPSIRNLSYISGAEGVLQQPLIGAVYRAFYNIVNDLNIYLTRGYIVYYGLGYYLVCYTKLSHIRGFLYGTILTIVGTLVVFFEIRFSISKESAGLMMRHDQVGILMQTCGLFLIAKSSVFRRAISMLSKMSSVTFGIYLVHPMLIELLQKNKIDSLSFYPIISVPLIALCIFGAAALLIKMMMITSLKTLVQYSRGIGKT